MYSHCNSWWPVCQSDLIFISWSLLSIFIFLFLLQSWGLLEVSSTGEFSQPLSEGSLGFLFDCAKRFEMLCGKKVDWLIQMGSIHSSVIPSSRVNVWAAQRFHVNKDAAESPGGLLPCCLFKAGGRSLEAPQHKICSHLVWHCDDAARRQNEPHSLIIIPQCLSLTP